MSFRGQAFAFESPAAAVAGMIARLRIVPQARSVEECDVGAGCGLTGRILAEPVAADRDSPAFDYSAMDGYAAKLSDLAGPTDHSPTRTNGEPGEGITLPVVGEARIGYEPPTMPRDPDEPGVVRIVTGAGVPRDADVIIKREDVLEQPQREGGSGVGSITISRSAAGRIRAGDYIRRRAENARAGDEVLGTGTVLSAAALGTLAATGCVRRRVYARLRVAIIVTGDELVPPSAMPNPFQIRNSNGPAVGAVLAGHAWLTVVSIVQARDDGERLGTLLRETIAGADAVILTGGVSMGHRDPVRGVIESVRAEVVFHGLPQRPGKPMLGAVAATAGNRCVPIFGLPGNPISAMVTCLRIVVPTLAACAGAARWPAPPRITLVNPDGNTLGLWWHRLVRLSELGGAELVDGRSSGDIIAGGHSDGFIEMPPGGADAHAPSLYSFYPWPT